MAAGSENTFDTLYRTYKVPLYNYVRKMTGSLTVADEIVQTVFLKFFENLNRIQKPGSYNFWLFKAARNEIYKHYKSKADNRLVSADTEAETCGTDTIELEYDKKELLAYISRELDKLPVEQKEVYLLKEYSGLSYREISEITGTEENVLRKRLFDAKNKLVKNLSNIYLSRG